MPGKKNEASGEDIYQLLLEESKKRKKERRSQLLESMEVTDFFEDGSININARTCEGVSCKLCIKACPTSALYWKSGEVGIVKDLCVFCAACVLTCIVNDCITITRKRPNGRIEKFSKPSDVLSLLKNINSRKRKKIVESRLPPD